MMGVDIPACFCLDMAMEVLFKDERLDRLETYTRYDAGFAQAVVTAYRKRIQFIRNALDERDFYQMKSLHFEKLKGNRSQQYSMRLNEQWRLIVEIKGNAPNKVIAVISIEDYH
jgi:proteic killer suppression protein